jgi:hypothetical protein
VVLVIDQPVPLSEALTDATRDTVEEIRHHDETATPDMRPSLGPMVFTDPLVTRWLKWCRPVRGSLHDLTDPIDSVPHLVDGH